MWLIYSVESNDGSNSMKITKPPGSPVADASKPSSEKGSANQGLMINVIVCSDLMMSLITGRIRPPASARSQARDYDDGLLHRGVKVRGTTSSAESTRKARVAQQASIHKTDILP